MFIALLTMAAIAVGAALWLTRPHVKEGNLAKMIDDILPQTQCTKCGYPGCMPYAEAIASNRADINLCPPGGEEGIRMIARLLGVRFKPFDEDVLLKPKSLAVIDENLCIGCTLCLQACPVDAIAGTAKQMHTIIAAECTGCELCVAPCPVECISMVPLPQQKRNKQAADHARERYVFHQYRIERDRQEKAEKLAAKEKAIKERTQGISTDPAYAAQQKIQAAIERARQAAVKPKNTENLTPQQLEKIAEIEARRAHLRELTNKQDSS